MDQSRFVTSHTLNFFMDSSAGATKGFGCVFDKNWTCGLWGKKFINTQKTTIQYLELYALCAGIFTWADKLSNTRIIIFCDNQAVVEMVNNYTSSCRICMHLIRLLVLNCLIHNRRISVKYVESKKNVLADALSHTDYLKFWKHASPTMNKVPDPLPKEIWPIHMVWNSRLK